MNKRLMKFTLLVFIGSVSMPFVKIKALDNNIIDSNKLNIKKDIVQVALSNSNLQQRMRIDAPIIGQAVYTNMLEIDGWALDPSEITEVQVYVDDKCYGHAEIGLSRPDVERVYPGYPQGKFSGFNYRIDLSSLSKGKHNIKVDVIKKNGIKNTGLTSIDYQPISTLLVVDYPYNNVTISSKKFEISGWCISSAGIKEVNIYANSILKGKAEKNLARPDVANVFPKVSGSYNSGYCYEIESSSLKYGINDILVECIDNNGNKEKKQYVININRPEVLFNLETKIGNISDNTEKIKVGGWVLDPSGIKDINFYVDGALQTNSYKLYDRIDVKNAFPQYNILNSGFDAEVDAKSLVEGSHNLTIEVVGNDGYRSKKNISFEKKVAKTILGLEAPQNNKSFNSRNIEISGWAVNPTGISKVRVLLDGKEKAITKTQYDRADVERHFRDYYDSRRSGFTYVYDTTSEIPGKHVITVEAIGNNGHKITDSRTIIIEKKRPIMNVESSMIVTSGKNELEISGWCINDSGVKEVQVYLNENMVGKASYGTFRSDVNKAFPGYPSANFSGFYYNLDVTELTGSSAALTIVSIGNDGTYTEIRGTIQIRRQTIVIDPGHNHGNNDGAYASHDGIQYCERELNMQLARKLADNLMARGYNVILTRTENDRFYEGVSDNLARVVGIANGSNAELFVSIHHDWSESASPNGVSTHYSSWRPNLDNEGLYNVGDVTYDLSPTAAASASARLAQQIVNDASSLGYMNRGALDHNLYVTRNTNMVSLLIEAGFLTNKSDAIRCANSTKQQEFANKIVETIEQYFQKK